MVAGERLNQSGLKATGAWLCVCHEVPCSVSPGYRLWFFQRYSTRCGALIATLLGVFCGTRWDSYSGTHSGTHCGACIGTHCSMCCVVIAVALAVVCAVPGINVKVLWPV